MKPLGSLNTRVFMAAFPRGDCGAGFVVIAGNFLERPVSFLNQVFDLI